MSIDYRDPCLLSRRELEILQLMAQGKNAREIAAELCIAYKTVRGHMHVIYTKLHVDSRAQAIVKAQWLGLIRINGLSPVACAIVQLLQVEPDALSELIEAGIVRMEE